MHLLPQNRSGWIEIMEATVAVLLIAGVLLIVLNNQQSSSESDLSTQIYETELSILREIQTNESLRADIISVSEVPVGWDSELFPDSVKEKINSRVPSYLECEARICYMDDSCGLGENKEKNIYSQSVSIISTLQEVSYRQLNMFCWVK